MRHLQDNEGHDFLALEESDWNRVKTWALRGAAGLLGAAAVLGYAVGAWGMGLSRDVREVRAIDPAIVNGLGRLECRRNLGDALLAGIPCGAIMVKPLLESAAHP